MNSDLDPEFAALMAARDFGIGTIMFRNALAKRFGLNLTESLCLTILGTRGSATPTELAKFIGLTTGATTTLLDRLEARGFVRRRPNPADRRGILIETDEAYAAKAQKLVAGIQKAHRDLISRYSGPELLLIAEFLRGMTENMRVQGELVGEVEL